INSWQWLSRNSELINNYGFTNKKTILVNGLIYYSYSISEFFQNPNFLHATLALIGTYVSVAGWKLRWQV
ncbi:hypothetical protein, partial [Spiroplasma sp. ald]|uniref:hypothetical protein n=1 Tax=Spiroplasma sp. ald TaxID=2490849 RepID=UPI0037DC649C